MLLLCTVGKYMKNKTKFNKKPYPENEMVASNETLNLFQVRGGGDIDKSCLNVDEIHIAISKETI